MPTRTSSLPACKRDGGMPQASRQEGSKSPCAPPRSRFRIESASEPDSTRSTREEADGVQEEARSECPFRSEGEFERTRCSCACRRKPDEMQPVRFAACACDSVYRVTHTSLILRQHVWYPVAGQGRGGNLWKRSVLGPLSICNRSPAPRRSGSWQPL